MVHIIPLRFGRVVRNMALVLLMAVASINAAFGQATTQFEYVYGGDCHEVGRDVKPVQYCDGNGGFIAVGTTNSLTNSIDQLCLSDKDVYVVRTDEAGARLWEYRYNISATNSEDEGNAIIECADGTGFVIAGTRATSTTASDAFLLKIKCNGDVDWCHTYNPGGLDSAMDLVEATLGNNGTNFVGDLMVCGTTQTPGTPPQLDGLVFRVSSNGATIRWSSTLKITGSDESLFSIAEAPLAPGTGNPDVVAAGRSISNGQSDGYAVRLKAYAGTIPGAPQGAVVYGGNTWDESFHSVKVLKQGTEQYNMVFVGKTNTPTAGGSTDIFLVKTAASPATLLAMNAIDNAGSPGGLNEEGMDVIEVAGANWFPGVGTTGGANTIAVGELVLTGLVEGIYQGSASPEMFILPVKVSSLGIFTGGTSGGGLLFGDLTPGGTAIESGAALEEIADTIIICGLSQGNLENDLGAADPEDLYLVKVDVNGKSACETGWTGQNVSISGMNAVAPTIETTNTATDRTPQETLMTTANIVCARPSGQYWGKPSKSPSEGNGGTSEAPFDLHVVPNPLPTSSALRLDLSGVDEGTLDIIVTDLTGQEVYRLTSPAPWRRGTIVIPTGAWAKGTYHVTVRNGSSRGGTTRVIIP